MTDDEKELLSPPGDTIKETLDYKKWTVEYFSAGMGITPSIAHDLISGKEPITEYLAAKLEMVLGIDAMFWLNRERLYREKLAKLSK